MYSVSPRQTESNRAGPTLLRTLAILLKIEMLKLNRAVPPEQELERYSVYNYTGINW